MRYVGNKQAGHVAAVLAVVGILAIGGVLAAVWYAKTHDTKAADTATTDTTSMTDTKQTQTSTNTLAKRADEDLTKLPIGDGKVSSSGAKAGYVYSCSSSFRTGGADHAGSWINGSTWNAKSKPKVDGSVTWPSAKVSFKLSGSQRIISGNGLPINNIPTGEFPIRAGSTAYQYDRNPNSIKSQSVYYSVPANPTIAASPSCVPMGQIGYMLDGVAVYNALDDGGRDAAAHEVQDKCDGHPQKQGVYHYHSMSDCIKDADKNNTLVGYALDGFGIFSDRDANGTQYRSSDLDECHGITSKIMWDGKEVSMYHYVLTPDYPYTIGCFRGHYTPTHP